MSFANDVALVPSEVMDPDTAFAISTLRPYSQQYKLKGAAMSVASELARAKQDAVRTHLCHYFVPVSTTQYRIVRVSVDAEPA